MRSLVSSVQNILKSANSKSNPSTESKANDSIPLKDNDDCLEPNDLSKPYFWVICDDDQITLVKSYILLLLFFYFFILNCNFYLILRLLYTRLQITFRPNRWMKKWYKKLMHMCYFTLRLINKSLVFSKDYDMYYKTIN